MFFKLSLLAECQFWVTRAIGSLDSADGDARLDSTLHAAFGLVQMLTGGITEQIEPSLCRALELAKKVRDVSGQLRMMDRLHLLYVLAGNFDGALDISRQGEAIAATHGDFVALARMQTSVSIAYHLLGHVPASRSYVDAALLHSPGIDPDLHSHLNLDFPYRAKITFARILWFQGYPEQAMETARQVVGDVISIDHPVTLCRTLLWVFAVYYWNSELEEFEEYADRIMLEARRYSIDYLQAVGQGVKGIVRVARGDTGDGLVRIQDSVKKLHSHGYGPQTDFSVQLAETMLKAGKHDDALEMTVTAIARAEQHNFMLERAELLRLKGLALIATKRPDVVRAVECLKQSLELARRQRARGFELRTAVSLARLWQQEGRQREARDLLAPVYDRFTESFNTRGLTNARELLIELDPPRSDLLAVH